jgi:hypothetical protein
MRKRSASWRESAVSEVRAIESELPSDLAPGRPAVDVFWSNAPGPTITGTHLGLVSLVRRDFGKIERNLVKRRERPDGPGEPPVLNRIVFVHRRTSTVLQIGTA